MKASPHLFGDESPFIATIRSNAVYESAGSGVDKTIARRGKRHTAASSAQRCDPGDQPLGARGANAENSAMAMHFQADGDDAGMPTSRSIRSAREPEPVEDGEASPRSPNARDVGRLIPREGEDHAD